MSQHLYFSPSSNTNQTSVESPSPYPGSGFNFSLPSSERFLNEPSVSMPYVKGGIPGVDFPFGHPLTKSTTHTGAIDFPYPRGDGKSRMGEDELDFHAASMSNNYGLGNDAEIDATVEIASAAAAAAIDESVERFMTAASGGAFIPGTSFDDGFDSV
jgi:hypothetical protein